MLRAKKPCKQRYEVESQERDAGAGHQLLYALRLGAGIIVAITFQQINDAPYAQSSAKGYDEYLEGIYSLSKEFHTIFTIFGNVCPEPFFLFLYEGMKSGEELAAFAYFA